MCVYVLHVKYSINNYNSNNKYNDGIIIRFIMVIIAIIIITITITIIIT